MKEIQIKCKGSGVATLAELKEFQGDLKFLTDESLEKFKKNLKKYGISAPFLVWGTQNGKKCKELKILDGHQRKVALLALKADGYKIPDKVPIVEVDVKNEKEAREKVLAFVSQYGDFNYQTDFFEGMDDLDFETFDLSANFGKFDFFKEDEDESEGGDADPIDKTNHVCPNCGHEF